MSNQQFPNIAHLKQKADAKDVLLADLQKQLKNIDEAITGTDWVFSGAEKRDGEWRNEAEERRAALFERRRLLMPDLHTAEQASREAQNRYQEAEQREREHTEATAWQSRTRAQLDAGIKAADRATEAAEAALFDTKADLNTAHARLHECSAAIDGETLAGEVLERAQGLLWLTPDDPASKVEVVTASTAHFQAMANAAGAKGARAQLESDVESATASMEQARAAVESAKQKAQSARVALTMFDLNSHVAQLGSDLDALAQIDSGEAMRLRRALRDGLVHLTHRGRFERPSWLGHSA